MIGTVIGLVTAIKMFAIDVDVLAIPYINKGVRLTENATIEQHGIQICIPGGTELLMAREMPEGNVYMLSIYSFDMNSIFKTKPIGTKAKAFIALGDGY